MVLSLMLISKSAPFRPHVAFNLTGELVSYMSLLSYFLSLVTQSACVSAPMAVPKTTSETLKHKINPSAGETAPQAVDVLLYTPGKVTSHCSWL